MKKLNKEMKNQKPISFLLTGLLLFTFLAGVRLYLFENIYKAYNLGNLGGVGAKLNVSVIVAGFLAISVIIGLVLSLLTKNKLRENSSATFCFISGLATIVFLFFTPYNLQLVLPTQIMQNLAMINCIAVMVFSLVVSSIFVYTIVIQIIQLCQSNKKSFLVLLGVSVFACLVISMLTVSLNWSFSILANFYAWCLLIISLADILWSKSNQSITVVYNSKAKITLTGFVVVSFFIIAIGCYIVAPMIAIVG